jgi:hypothetical protein
MALKQEEQFQVAVKAWCLLTRVGKVNCRQLVFSFGHTPLHLSLELIAGWMLLSR